MKAKSFIFCLPNYVPFAEETPVHIHPPDCAGVRCSLGECIEERRICNGIRDCKDGNDESDEQCSHKQNNCNHTDCGMFTYGS